MHTSTQLHTLFVVRHVQLVMNHVFTRKAPKRLQNRRLGFCYTCPTRIRIDTSRKNRNMRGVNKLREYPKYLFKIFIKTATMFYHLQTSHYKGTYI